VMKRRARRTLTLALALAALGLLALATGAQAATLTTKCSGKGPQNKAQEYETASCAVEAGQKRNIEGVVRNDKNKPVATTLKVTFSNWEPQGGGVYNITPQKTIEVKSAANGKFKVPNLAAPKTEETVFVEAPENGDAELSTVTTEVNIQRLITATVKKLGGDKVKVTIKGAPSPFKIGIIEEGYPASGGAARKANKAGSATFNLRGTYGELGVLFEGGAAGELFYFAGKTFKL
jgi:nitrogen regulatory protein PII